MVNEEKFQALVSKDETNTIERAKARLSRKGYTRISKKIAIAILVQLDELNWKQVNLAEKMGVSPQQVSKWVKGNENFTLETLSKLGDVLGIELVKVPEIKVENVLQSKIFGISEEYFIPDPSRRLTPRINLVDNRSYENAFYIAN